MSGPVFAHRAHRVVGCRARRFQCPSLCTRPRCSWYPPLPRVCAYARATQSAGRRWRARATVPSQRVGTRRKEQALTVFGRWIEYHYLPAIAAPANFEDHTNSRFLLSLENDKIARLRAATRPTHTIGRGTYDSERLQCSEMHT